MGEFIPQDFYRFAYFFVALLTVIFQTSSGNPLRRESENTSYLNALILGIFYIIFFGTRPYTGSWMADTSGYVGAYNLYRNTDFINLEIGDHEMVWDWLCKFMSTAGFAPWVWLTVVAAIYILFNIWGAKLIFPKHVYLAFLFYSVFFLFYSGGINGIRNADAYSIVFYSIALFYRSKMRSYIIITILCLIAYQIHTSVIVTILSFVISVYLVKKTNHAIYIWLAAIVITLIAGNYLANFASGLIDDGRAEKYLRYANDSNMMKGFSHTGFRWDFLLFSSLPIALGWYATVKRGINDRFFQILLNTYIIANAVWIVFIYAAFSNRFAMLSWCIYPYVLLYPMVKFKLWDIATQNRYTSFLLWIMLLFSGYMNVFV